MFIFLLFYNVLYKFIKISIKISGMSAKVVIKMVSYSYLIQNLSGKDR
jgi:hypothetical protein